MDNITTVLLAKCMQININESLKQATTFVFDNGDTQNMGRKTNPHIVVDITYRNLSYSDFVEIEETYQSYFANTFIVELENYEDVRRIVGGLEGAVWGFGAFEFEARANTNGLYDGKISIITSTFYNFPEYQALYTEALTSYSVTETDNTEFIDILADYNPVKVKIEYILNTLTSIIGKSIHLQQDKTGSAKSFTMDFLINSEGYFELLAFYRGKGAIRTFGIPTRGYLTPNFDPETDTIMLCKFNNDEIKRTKLNNGLNLITLTVVQVS